MPKAVAVVQNVVASEVDGSLTVQYSVAVDKENGTGANWSGDAPAGIGLTIAQWKTAARNKIVQDCESFGITLTANDVIIVGGPMA